MSRIRLSRIRYEIPEYFKRGKYDPSTLWSRYGKGVLRESPPPRRSITFKSGEAANYGVG